MATKKQICAFHFYHGGYGLYADRDDIEDIWWDGEGDAPEGIEAITDAEEWWESTGYNEAMQEEADALGDYLYEMSLD